MPESPRNLQQRAIRELAVFLGLLFFGLVILPVGIYLVGQKVFGSYAGYGYADFFGDISGKIRRGDIFTWFLVLSPYLIWQTLRLTRAGWRLTGKI
ncbi:MAG: hypothetical protein KJO82_02660 [Gammaproteobacteria bacterium]|nr:hypothetical protein [Gammaproteobacteria bacterium]